ncbi:MAG: SxtJ family membrane protein [Pirellulaceae bacterium]
MGLIEVRTDFSDREIRQFAGIWLPAFALLVGLILWNKLQLPNAALAVWGVTVAVALVGLLKPKAIRPLLLGWMFAAFPIGWVVSHVMLAVIYYGCMTPIGLFMRLIGKDPLNRKLDRSAETYWVAREPTTDTKRYFRQF